MEEYFEPPVQPVLFRATLGFRRRLERLDDLWLAMFISNIIAWTKFRNFTLESWTMGIHENASYPHVHYHMVVWTSKILSNSMSTFKYDTLNSRYELNCLQIPFQIKDIIGENRYTSIQMRVLPSHEDEIAFLQYPFKEGNLATLDKLDNPRYNQLKDMCIDTMVEQSHAVYLTSLKKRDEKKAVEVKKETEWELLCSICDPLPRYFDQIVLHVLRYYRDNVEHPPHPQILVKRAEKYCFKKGILSVEECANTYSQFLGMPPKYN